MWPGHPSSSGQKLWQQSFQLSLSLSVKPPAAAVFYVPENRKGSREKRRGLVGSDRKVFYGMSVYMEITLSTMQGTPSLLASTIYSIPSPPCVFSLVPPVSESLPTLHCDSPQTASVEVTRKYTCVHISIFTAWRTYVSSIVNLLLPHTSTYNKSPSVPRHFWKWVH